MEINTLDVTDDSNTDRFPEGQVPSSVNNSARALEGLLARWHKDINGSLVSAGSANAYTLAPNRTISAYYDGLTFCFEANFSNTGAATLNVNAVGAQAIVWPDGTALASGDIPSSAKVVVCYDSDNTQWMLMNPTTAPASNILTTRGDLLTRGASALSRLAIGAADTFLRSNGTDPSWVANVARIKTGTYTGDGTESQAITGVGFSPKYLKIWPRETVDNTSGPVFETTDTIVDDNAAGGTWAHSGGGGHAFNTDHIISLDADGFTVDDSAVDANPNKNGIVYNYLAFG